MSAFGSELDIANRALQLLRTHRISAFTDHTLEAQEMSFAFTRMRDAELTTHLWGFSIWRSMLRPVTVDTVTWTPPAWSAGSFSVGAVVAYTPTTGPYANISGLWQTWTPKTGASTASPDNDDWRAFVGTIAADLYDSGITYFTGETVVVPGAWLVGSTYAANAVVRSGTTWYVSLAGSNTGNAVTDTTWWVEWTGTGRGSSDFGVTANGSPVPLTYPETPSVYLSLCNGNADNPLDGTGTWLDLDATVTALRLFYPIGTGPASDTTTANVFRLPYGFLRQAPSNPKAATRLALGAGGGNPREDWIFEDQYLVSQSPGPLMLRFVADQRSVLSMPPTFCEMLAARLALEVGPRLPGASEDYNRLRRVYRDARQEAIGLNAIETGPIDLELSDYLAVRLT